MLSLFADSNAKGAAARGGTMKRNDAILEAATFLTRGEAVYRGNLVVHLTPYDNRANGWLAAVGGALVKGGASPEISSRQALELLSGMVNRQAAFLSYNHVFLLLGILFLLCLPLVGLLRRGSPSLAEPVVLE
jgi:DHA2 family multidrug resistance protein